MKCPYEEVCPNYEPIPGVVDCAYEYEGSNKYEWCFRFLLERWYSDMKADEDWYEVYKQIYKEA